MSDRNYIFIELPKFEKSLKELQTAEERWLYLLKNMPEEKSKPELQDSIFEEAYEKLRIRAESSNLITKVVTDMVTEAEIECRLDDSYKEGIEQGIEKGIEQGIEKGSLNTKHEMVKAMLKKGLSISDIIAISGLSEEEIKSL